MFGRPDSLNRHRIAGAVLSLTVAQAAVSEQPAGAADVVYHNGFVYTVDAVSSRAQAFAVRDGKFQKVGSNDDMKPVTGKDTRVVDLEGRMVMPGIVDGHIHPVRGALTKLGVKFEQDATVDEIRDRRREGRCGASRQVEYLLPR